MSYGTQWAVFLALVLTGVLGIFLGKVMEPDLPRCSQGMVWVGLGEWTNGRYAMYACGAPDGQPQFEDHIGD